MRNKLFNVIMVAFLLFNVNAIASAAVMNVASATYRMGTSDYWVGNGTPQLPVPISTSNEYSECREVITPTGNYASGTATVSAILEPSPSVFASFSSVYGGNGKSADSYIDGYEHYDDYYIPTKAYSYMDYYYYISGPNNSYVPIIIDYKLRIMSSGSVLDWDHGINAGVMSLAWISAGFGSKSINIPYGESGGAIEFDGEFYGNVVANMLSTGYHIGLHAEVGSHNYAGYYGGLMEGYAFVDPVIRIDPAFEFASLYTVHLSPGLGNSWTSAPAPTPEPCSFMLMASGMVVAGVVVRRKRLHKV
ncbi:hypothetical protein [Nitratidesulfovibrio liaohensis]|uniref:hypothetical protein n=1 Tax=Nitratidesulfovibrio liaohensis TaxID=2604158 RepID=UPI001423F309|nr:hypothetical protein [Nitratidesulfovibrio liaohensis]NHZ45932.1 hypothetical protein [Nitratidesulfovibrio liaohensis]